MNGEQRVLVMAPNWLGDAVMALPAVADVKRHFRDARLIVAARTAVAPMYSLVPGVDEVIALQWRGGATRRRARQQDVGRLRAAGAEVAVLFPNSFAAAWMVKDVGIGERWGYASDWRGPLLTRRVRRPRRSMHQAAYYQTLVRELGIANGPLDPQVEVPAAVVDAARALLVARGWNGSARLVAIAPGAAYGTAKRWLPRHFARLIATLAREQQATCVLVGSGGDAETTQWIARAAGSGTAPVIDLAGATSLEMLAGVLSLASACVSNDSGAMHLAGAVGVPLAALFGPTREYETAPLTRQGGRLEVLINPVWCRPCMLRECPLDHRCMRGLSPERVADAAARLMSATPS
jgi:heptosyltransferase-2